MNNATLYGARVTYQFATRDRAWQFMRAADAAGIAAGFPGLKDHTVQTVVPGHRELELDQLAESHFGRVT
jgi:hypothetical protein